MSSFRGLWKNFLDTKTLSHNDNIKVSLEMGNDSQGNVKESNFGRYWAATEGLSTT